MRAPLICQAKRITQQMKEKAPTEDKRVIAKLKQQFEQELEKYRTITKTMEAREREILVAMSSHEKGTSRRQVFLCVSSSCFLVC